MLALTLCPVPSGCGRRVSLKRRIREDSSASRKISRVGTMLPDAFEQSRKTLQRGAFANIHHQRRSPDRRRVFSELGELRDQLDGQIVHRIVAQILQTP